VEAAAGGGGGCGQLAPLEKGVSKLGTGCRYQRGLTLSLSSSHAVLPYHTAAAAVTTAATVPTAPATTPKIAIHDGMVVLVMAVCVYVCVCVCVVEEA